MARLETDGRAERTLDVNVYGFDVDFPFISATAVQPDGKILIGGSFRFVLGGTRLNLARLNTDGTLDNFDPRPISVFTENFIGRISAIALQADGKILVGGTFTSIGGQARTNIARLDSITGLPDTFNPNANGAVLSLAVQADEKILVGGTFTSIGGQARTNIARLEPNGVVDKGFNANAGEFGLVSTIAVQADGKILVGGFFSSIGGQRRNNIARLNPGGAADIAFNPNAAGNINCITVQADGKILVGGSFTSIGGQARTNIARLINDTVAADNLTVAQTAVTWIRGGSSPQFSRVTFEDSTDGVSYNFLGNGTAAGNNWTLTSLNLSIGQSLFIRGRGHYGSGNRSESIQETVRNTFLVAQPLLNIHRSGNTDVVLSWTTNSIGFTLEANTKLNTNVWSVVSPAPVVRGANNIVTNGATGAQKFYRLSRP
jgi:uncharacterized delta-60 repeat protein